MALTLARVSSGRCGVICRHVRVARSGADDSHAALHRRQRAGGAARVAGHAGRRRRAAGGGSGRTAGRHRGMHQRRFARAQRELRADAAGGRGGLAGRRAGGDRARPRDRVSRRVWTAPGWAWACR